MRGQVRQGPGGGHPAAAAGQPLSWRGLSQAVGAAALRRHPHQPPSCSSADPGARPAGVATCRSATGLEGPRRHDHHRAGRPDVGHRPDLGHDRRGPGRRLHRPRSLLGRVRRPARQPQRQSLRGARAGQAGGARALWRVRQGHRHRPPAAPRSRQPVRQPRLPGRDPLPWYRQLTGVRARARRQWLCRALHPDLEGEPAVGPPLRDGRGAAPGASGLQGALQSDLDHRAARVPDARSGPSQADRGHADGRLSAERCLRIVDRYTGPASIDPDTGKPYGMRFPIVTIRDFVNVQKALLEHLGIRSLHAVAGASMGALQAFEWASAYPDWVKRVVAVIGGAEENAFLIGWLNLWAAPIRLDPRWNGGDYYGGPEPVRGLTEALKIITLQAQQWAWCERFGRAWAEDGKDPRAAMG